MSIEQIDDRLTQRHTGDGWSFAHPATTRLVTDIDDRTMESVVLDVAERPVLVAAAVEESPADMAVLQVPGELGTVLAKYEAKGGYEQLGYERVTVEGSDAAELAEIRYGTGDPTQAVIVSARVADRRIVTLQVHFPPSTADVDRPLAMAIIDSLRIDAAF